jgi:hypothetical protein
LPLLLTLSGSPAFFDLPAPRTPHPATEPGLRGSVLLLVSDTALLFVSETALLLVSDTVLLFVSLGNRV